MGAAPTVPLPGHPKPRLARGPPAQRAADGAGDPARGHGRGHAAPAPRPPPRAGSSVAFSHGLCGFRCQDPGASRPSPPRSRRRREPGRASSPQRALSSGRTAAPAALGGTRRLPKGGVLRCRRLRTLNTSRRPSDAPLEARKPPGATGVSPLRALLPDGSRPPPLPPSPANPHIPISQNFCPAASALSFQGADVHLSA